MAARRASYARSTGGPRPSAARAARDELAFSACSAVIVPERVSWATAVSGITQAIEASSQHPKASGHCFRHRAIRGPPLTRLFTKVRPSGRRNSPYVVITVSTRCDARCPPPGVPGVSAYFSGRKSIVAGLSSTWPSSCSRGAAEDVHIMRIARCIVIGAVLVALTPSAGSAQDKRVFVNIGGGPDVQRRRHRGTLCEWMGPGDRRDVRCEPEDRIPVRVRLPLVRHQGRRARLRCDQVLGQPSDTPAGFQHHRQCHARRQPYPSLFHGWPRLLQPQSRNHGVHRQRCHL